MNTSAFSFVELNPEPTGKPISDLMAARYSRAGVFAMIPIKIPRAVGACPTNFLDAYIHGIEHASASYCSLQYACFLRFHVPSRLFISADEPP